MGIAGEGNRRREEGTRKRTALGPQDLHHRAQLRHARSEGRTPRRYASYPSGLERFQPAHKEVPNGVPTWRRDLIRERRFRRRVQCQPPTYSRSGSVIMMIFVGCTLRMATGDTSIHIKCSAAYNTGVKEKKRR